MSEEPVHISLKPDSESIASSINELVSGYNNLVSVTTSEENEKFTGNNRLRRDFMQISNAYTNLFANTVFDVSDNGSIAIDHEQLSIAAANGSINDVFTNLGRFKNVILQKADDISINPMEYVNNKIISYKNPNRAIMDPYNTSMYSGMMFNGYI